MKQKEVNPEFINAIRRVSDLPEMLEVRKSEEFWLEKLRVRWNEFQTMDEFIYQKKGQKANGYSGINYSIDWTLMQSLFYDSKSSFSVFYNSLSPDEFKDSAALYTFTVIGKIIAHFDINTFNSKNWNEYSPARHLVFSGAMTTTWVKNLLKYKVAKNSWDVLSPNIRNAVHFIKEPAAMIAMVSPKHARLFAERILQNGYSDDDHFTFCRQVIDLFRMAEISCVHPENMGILIGKILYHPQVLLFWTNQDEDPDFGVVEPDEDGIVEEPENGNGPETTSSTTRYSRSAFAPTDDIPTTLGADRIAEELILLLESMGNGKGQMIGLFGQWGRGKSHLAKLTKESIQKQEKKFIWIDFHAWKYQDTHAVWAYLYESVSSRYFNEIPKEKWFRHTIDKYAKRFKVNLEKNGWWPWILLLLTIAGLTVSFFNVNLHALRSKWTISAGITSVLTVIIAYYNFVKKSAAEKASELIKRYFSQKSFSDLLGVQAEIQKEMKVLLKTWIKDPKTNRILLFVDDIDRCPEDQIIRIIDALRVMLEDDTIAERVLILTAVDERMLKRAIILKYHDMIKKDPMLVGENEKLEFQKITQEYMDKLFISGIKLGVLTFDDRKQILSNLIIHQERISDKKIVTVIDQNVETYLEQKETAVENGQKNVAAPAAPVNRPTESVQQNTAAQSAPAPAVNPVSETNAASQNATVEDFIFLNDNEEKALLKSISLLSDATPRKIRIHYYRYLLARNLLTAEMSKADSVQPEFLADYLAVYASPENVITITGRKSSFNEDTPGLVDLPLPAGETRIPVAKLNSAAARKFFEVLETVIAY